MRSYEELKKKWQNAHKREKPFAWKNYDELAPGKFCVLSTTCGACGPD